MELPNMLFKIFAKKLINAAEQQDDQEFQDQLMQNPRDVKEFLFIKKLWDEAGRLQIFDQIDTASDFERIGNRINRRFPPRYHKIIWSKYFLRIAALVILTFGLTFGFYKILTYTGKGDTGFLSYSADKELRDIILPDGSSVSLNVGSTLTCRDDFGRQSREVILNGEALFNVVSSEALPFKVYSGKSLIEVTGTSFSVREINGMIQVVVITGTVVLSSKDSLQHKISINANQSGYLLNNQKLMVEDGVPVNILSWKTGDLIFDQVLLDSALLDIARHFNRELIMDVALKERITAHFRNQPLHEILEELNLVTGFRFDTTNTALIVRK